ncbi:putative translation releasing factor RF-1 [Trichoderma citrinoviride]|uniref:Putative translation releasing factor RF-1 n=1 Tax=Trichoderma citrinoviride TaxID=58853 RepID=A0A2T4BGH9_9HYPO|nr:putative translation releasing factor RF-1 [Trichoderma citrinoviride]PTB68436.1 putative translation releasing factor RF-1 [Trichoderma citrinoviride]
MIGCRPHVCIRPPPDGGLRAWLQIVAGHLVVFTTWGYIISFGIFQPYYMQELHLEPSSVSWIGSIQTCLLFVIGTFTGRAFDAGYYRLCLITGFIMQLVGIFTTSVATTYWQLFLSQGLCQGLGCGLVFAPTIANMTTYFSKKRTLALSAAACGGGTGGVIFPLIAQQLIPQVGFRWTVRAMGLVVLVCSVIIVLLVRTRLPPRKAGPLVDWGAFKEMTYVLFAISMFFTLWATYFAYFYARAYSIDRLGGSQATSFNMLMIINAVGIPGRLIPAFLADRFFGAVNVFIPTILSAAICIFAWAGVNSVTGDYIWVIFFGYFGAGIQGMFPATTAGLTKDLSKSGVRIGMIFTIISVASLTGPPLAGKLVVVAHGSYIGAQIWDAASTSSSLAPSLLRRAQSLSAEHDDLQKGLNSSFDAAKAKRAGELGRVASALREWETAQSSILELTSMAQDPDQDPDLASIARDELESERAKLDLLEKKLKESLTPKHAFAHLPCMVEFRPGPGGLEGRYFTDTLFKMYKALCARKGYRANVLKYEMAEAAGDQSSSSGEQPVQEAILEIQDEGAYDLFRGEAGMHRVQRIPSTESKGRVHTSAVAVWVLPSFPEGGTGGDNVDVEDPESDLYINPQDVKIETMRARGAGGQHVNKTESAIRMTHIPTGTVVSMQDHRSQQRNREDAWKVLRSRIASQRAEQREEEAARLRSSVLSQAQITRGDKIRTYNYNQDRCTDHRAGIDVHNLPNVLEGGEMLDRVMEAAREWLVGKEVEMLVMEEEAKAKK